MAALDNALTGDLLAVAPFPRAKSSNGGLVVYVVIPTAADQQIVQAATEAAVAAADALLAGKAASGENTDITSLSGLTTALSLAQGGTGAKTDSGARAALGLPLVPDDTQFNTAMTALWVAWANSLPVWSGSGSAPVPTGRPYNLGPGGPVVIAQ